MDFTDEDIDVMTEGNIQKRLSSLQSQLQRLCQMAQQGVLLQQGMSLLLLGEPNAGKSSLLNYFSQRDSAIVTEIPGTTRDVLRESIQLKGIPVHLIDTAGLRDSTDPIEQEGIKRAWEEASRADVILMVVDSTQYDASALSSQITRVQQVAKETPMIVVYNKTDLLTTTQIDELHCAVPYQCVSVKTSDGMEALAEALVQCVGYDEKQEGCSARLRHVDALQRALTAIEHGASHFQSQGAIELMADDLRIAQQHLSEITGAYTSDDLLGAIFSTFCIGK